jgi:glycosyltransferase involved in cell wall biosynthesis
MIIDDGSQDNTIEIAKKYWVNHIIKNIGNKGLGNAFKSWVEKALKEWWDILVNTDGDNQYPWKYIQDLVVPILKKEADIVMGDRQTATIQHFSFIKKFFQWLWSALVRQMSWLEISDSVSGFRAYSREALLRLNITSKFSYAVDTLVQAWGKSIKVVSVKILTNKPTRSSRLFKNMWQHMYQTIKILFRVYAMYNPLRVFFSLAFPFFLVWVIWIFRFLYFFSLNPNATGKIQSLVLAWVSLIIAVQFFALGIIWDLIAKNRKLIEDNLYFTKKQYFNIKD